MKVVQLLDLQGPMWCQVCRYMDCLHCKSYGPLRVFFHTSCSWRSKGLFDQSFSVAPPFQALGGLPRLESFSVVWQVRHIEGPPLAGVLICRLAHQALKRAPWVGSYFVVQCIRHLMGHPLYCSGVERERLWWWLHPHAWLSSITLLPWLPSFPPQAFPTTISSLTSPQSVSLQSTAALALGLLQNP